VQWRLCRARHKRHEYASRLVERGVPLAQVRDLLGHASITTTERYDNQKLENLQIAAAKLESGLTFEPPQPEQPSESRGAAQGDEPRPRRKSARTKFQESFKYEGVTPRSHTVREVPAIAPNELSDLNLQDWLRSRASNPDTVVQSHIPYNLAPGFVTCWPQNPILFGPT
jgi:hypothetical protein